MATTSRLGTAASQPGNIQPGSDDASLPIHALTAPDADTVVHWTLDETAAPFANSGSGASLDLASSYGTPVVSPGLFGSSLHFEGVTGLKTADTSIGESTTALTVSIWVKLSAFITNGEIFDKKYEASTTWGPVYTAWTIGTIGTADGAWFAGVAIGGTRYFAKLGGTGSVNLAGAGIGIPLNRWTLLSLTYDGTTIRAYLNGALAGYLTQSGSISYGSHGAYQLGAATTQSAQGIKGFLDDPRVESVTRSASYLATMYAKAPTSITAMAADVADGSATATGALTRIGALAGTSAGGATATADLTRIKTLAGTAAAEASATGLANTGGHLQATAAGSSSATGRITSVTRIAGTAGAEGFARANLSGPRHATANAAGGATATGTLVRYRYAAGVARGGGTAAALLIPAGKRLAGVASGSATARGALLGVAHAVTFLEVEIPAFYVDGITMVAPDSPAIVNLQPDIDEGRGKGPPADANAWIEADLIDFGGDGIDGGQTRVTINGVDAMIAGVVQAGFEGALTSPSSDTKHARVRPLAAFTSSQAVTVTIATALNGGTLVSRTWMFNVADTVAPAIYGALGVDQKRVRVTWNEEVSLDPADPANALAPASYFIQYVQTDPLVPGVTPTVISVEPVTGAGTSPTIVDLVTDVALSPGRTYLVIAVGVEDIAGNVRSTTALGFTAFDPPRPADRDFDLWRMVPKMNRDEDETGDLRRFIGCMQEVTDLMLYGVDRFVDIFDPDIAPEVFVDAMLADLGNPFPFVLDLVKKRQLVKLLVPLYKQKGTRPGILAAIRFFVELDLTITTYTGTDMRLGLSRLGEDWILGPGNSFSLYAFTIVSPVALSAEERTMITFIANYMRVAHEHLVRIVEPTEPVAPDDPLVLGSSQLGGTNGLEWLLH